MRLTAWTLALLVLAGCASQASGSRNGVAEAPTTGAVIEPESELGQAMRDVPVAMYMTDWCPVCTRASAWLQANGFEVVEFNVERDQNAARIHRLLNPRGSVPTFDIDGMTMIGFSPRGFELIVAKIATTGFAPESTAAETK